MADSQSPMGKAGTTHLKGVQRKEDAGVPKHTVVVILPRPRIKYRFAGVQGELLQPAPHKTGRCPPNLPHRSSLAQDGGPRAPSMRPIPLPRPLHRGLHRMPGLS